jgi:hypothetical protein
MIPPAFYHDSASVLPRFHQRFTMRPPAFHHDSTEWCHLNSVPVSGPRGERMDHTTHGVLIDQKDSDSIN